jgi:hypothetical protein
MPKTGVGAEERQEMQDQASAMVERVAAPASFRMPSIYLGEIVLWSHAKGGDTYAGIVTRVGDKAISLFMMPPDSRRGEIRDGVRHVDDPELPKIISESGCWRDTRSMMLLRELGELRKRPEWMD